MNAKGIINFINVLTYKISPFILLGLLFILFLVDLIIGISNSYFTYYRYLLLFFAYLFISSYFLAISLDFKRYLSAVYIKFVISFLLLSSILTIISYLTTINNVNVAMTTGTIFVLIYMIVYSTKSIIESYVKKMNRKENQNT